jgi:PIN domain nuclease of toxin-antitoxin system
VILLDTHVWVWWVDGTTALSAAAQRAIDGAVTSGDLGVSSISTWEVALLVKKGRLRLAMDVEDWVARSEALPFIQFVPVDNHIAVRSVLLSSPLHDDPADRIIVATALALGASLVTKDERLRKLRPLKTIW